MPTVNITLPEVSQSVTRPVIFDIINQVQTITKIEKTTNIFFPGEIQKMQTPGSSIDSKDSRFAIFNTDRYNFIEIEEDYDINTLGSTAVTQKEHIPVFVDDKLFVYIKPIYATSNVKIDFKYRCPSKSEAIRWMDDMRIKVSHMRDLNLHDITYHYLLPLEFVLVLKEVYKKRENIAPYQESFEEYVTKHASDRLTLIGDSVNNDNRLAISETQCRIVGQFDFDGLPSKPERDDSTGTWLISFSYKFSYEKPIACNMKYPVIVHNQLLPELFTTFIDTSYDLSKVNKTFTKSLEALNNFEADTVIDKHYDVDYLIKIPSFDDYIIPYSPSGTGAVFTALLELDVNNTKALFNLTDLDAIIIDEDILDFIKKSEYPYIGKLYHSILHLQLYRDDALANTAAIICDDKLDLFSTIDLDLRKQYRVKLAIVTDITMLTKNAIDRLRKYPKALVKIIAAINELLKNSPEFSKLSDNNRVTAFDFSKIFKIITGYEYGNNYGTNIVNYYDGLNINSWNGRINKDNLFGLDENLVESYRNNRIGQNTVQVHGIVSFPLDPEQR